MPGDVSAAAHGSAAGGGGGVASLSSGHGSRAGGRAACGATAEDRCAQKKKKEGFQFHVVKPVWVPGTRTNFAEP